MAKTTKRIYRKYGAAIDEDESCLVYWIFNDTCNSPERDGFVGQTSNAKREIGRALKRFNTQQFKILFRGTREECCAIEHKLRPRPHIGWNIHVGGFMHGDGGADVPKPVEQREKMAQAGLDRYADRKPRPESYERQRRAKNAKRAARRAAGLPRLY